MNRNRAGWQGSRINRTLGFWVLLAVSLAISGCADSWVVYKPETKFPPSPKHGLERKQTKVYEVIDDRDVAANFAGIVYTGSTNQKTSYKLTVPVRDYVGEKINQLFNAAETDSEFTPITIHIDQFKVSERTSASAESGYFDCRLRFIFPITVDSFAVARITTRQSVGKMDGSGALAGLIDDGIIDCTSQFLEKYYDRCQKYRISLTDSSNRSGYAMAHARLEKQEFTTAVPQSAVPQSAGTRALSQGTTGNFSSTGFLYYSGDKVENGFGISYDQFHRKPKSQFTSGFGYSLTYFRVLNYDKYLQGRFLNAGLYVGGRAYASSSKHGLFAEASIRFLGGTEYLDYGYKKVDNFFLGPMLEEKVGVNFMDAFYLQAGFYQVRLFGSDLLPSDAGFSLGVRFGM